VNYSIFVIKIRYRPCIARQKQFYFLFFWEINQEVLSYICTMLSLYKIKALFLVAFFLIASNGFSQHKKYEDAMKHTVAALDSAKGSGEYKKVASGFEQIAEQEKNEWLPYYYSGICYVLVALEQKGKDTDTWCDKAEYFSKKADSLSENNSEVKVLKSMITAARISVHKAQRGQKYGAMALKLAEEAIKLNPKNPRAYLQKATIVYHTPEVFGGGVKKAKPHAELAVEKYNAFKKEGFIMPHWGKSRAEKLLKQCSVPVETPKK
jgi:tetratricopeptide (TPR) repeat protein